MLAAFGQGADGVMDGRRTGSRGKGRCTVFQRGDAPLKHILGRVGQSAVDVSCIPQSEPVRRLLAVRKHKGSGSINGYRSGVGSRVCLFLADVQLFGFKAPMFGVANICHGIVLLRGRRLLYHSNSDAPSSMHRQCWDRAGPCRTTPGDGTGSSLWGSLSTIIKNGGPPVQYGKGMPGDRFFL